MKEKKIDFKTEYRDLYVPKSTPSVVDVPNMTFFMVDGFGNPNVENGEYQEAVELLYALSYTIKMSSKNNQQPEGFFDYVVPPLEGLWWLNDNTHTDFSVKEKYCWTSMIRQPDFVTPEVFQWACSEVSNKKPHLDVKKIRLQQWAEGLCVQLMHIGPYDAEPASIEKINDFIREHNYQNAVSDHLPDGTIRRHHEIYLNDPRKVDPSKIKTILRHPVRVATV